MEENYKQREKMSKFQSEKEKNILIKQINELSKQIENYKSIIHDLKIKQTNSQKQLQKIIE